MQEVRINRGIKVALHTQLEQRQAEGFDRSYVSSAEYVTIRCSQCDALVINGHACHEMGCQNRRIACPECGDMLPLLQRCDCMDGAYA